MIVVHAISLPPGQFGTGHVDRLFTNLLDHTAHPAYAALEGLKVSAHFLIDRLGVFTQYVSLEQRAWHAGESSFAGLKACNHRSIGIELEGSDEVPFTAAQYACLAMLCADLRQLHPAITLARIVGHSDIAPGRKTDPGPYFDWVALRAAVATAGFSGCRGPALRWSATPP